MPHAISSHFRDITEILLKKDPPHTHTQTHTHTHTHTEAEASVRDNAQSERDEKNRLKEIGLKKIYQD